MQGWRSKKSGQGRLFVSKEGEQFVTGRLALVHMHQQVGKDKIMIGNAAMISFKVGMYSEEEISKMRSGLAEEGWKEDAQLPHNWRLTTNLV